MNSYRFRKSIQIIGRSLKPATKLPFIFISVRNNIQPNHRSFVRICCFMFHEVVLFGLGGRSTSSENSVTIHCCAITAEKQVLFFIKYKPWKLVEPILFHTSITCWRFVFFSAFVLVYVLKFVWNINNCTWF